MVKYNSGRVKRFDQTGITSDRYQFLGIEQAEPDLGDPIVGVSSFSANPIPSGDQYVVVAIDGYVGKRFWIKSIDQQGAGLQGIQGLQGSLSNFQGTQGNQGIQGIQGLDGLFAGQGVQGPQGPQGLQGTQGLQGIQGTQGLQGIQGTQGLQGTFGLQGLSGSLANYVRKTTNYTAVAKDQLIADTSGGIFTITLPATPVTGNLVRIVDGASWVTNNLIIGRNGSTIEGLAEDLIIDIGGISLDFVYDSTTWEVYPSTGLSVISPVNTTTNATYYPLFVEGAGGNRIPNIRSTPLAFSFNPSTNTLNTNNVLIGSETPTGTALQPLQVGSASSIQGAYVSGSVGIGTTDPTSKLRVVGDVSVSGVITCTDLNTTSDINLKQNIQTFENASEIVNNLRGVRFEWKENHKPSIGIIAQEVEKVLPELVNGKNPKTINYNGLIGVLIEAVKGQQREINFLKKEIKLINGLNTKMEGNK